MPRMLAPRRDSLPRRGSSASFSGSRSSMNGSYGSGRRASLNHPNNYGSHLSLRRLSLNDGSSQSSSRSSMRQQAPMMYHHQMQQPSKQNAVWGNMEDQGSVGDSPPPSLVDSETSVQTDEQLSRSSSQSSFSLPPPPASLPTPPTGNDARYVALRRYYALRRASLQQGGLNSPRDQHPHAAPRRSSLGYPPSQGLPGSPGNSFLPQAQTVKEDTWGQFVDVQEADEELVRRSKLLSLTRRYPILSHSRGPAPLRR